MARKKGGRDWTPIVYISMIVALLLGALVFLVYSGSHAPKSINPAVGAQQNVGGQVQTEQANHIQPGTKAHYLTDPPTSGQHYSVRGEAPLPWGFYARAYPLEDWIHNLEHGGVVILYQCPQPSLLAARSWLRKTCPALTANLPFRTSSPRRLPKACSTR